MNKVFKATLLIFILISPTLLGISKSFANSIYPAKQEITLPTGQRTLSSVFFKNTQDRDIEVKLSVYTYDPKTDSISESKDNIFLKVDTDTFKIPANSQQEIKYEIYPLNNLLEGTYFNVLVMTPVQDKSLISLTDSISQLVVLHYITPENEVANITTKDFDISMQVVDKGIPFISPVKIKYIIKNNSNFVISPDGNIEILNKRGNYKPYSVSINREDKKIYPKETLEEVIEIKGFNITDIIFERYAIGHIYNGLDSNSKDITLEVSAYKIELLVFLCIILGILFLTKSLKEDISKS